MAAAAANEPLPAAEGAAETAVAGVSPAQDARDAQAAQWADDAQRELQKIPFFVRGKARRNTERFAAERGLSTITVETLYDAKAHYAR